MPKFGDVSDNKRETEDLGSAGGDDPHDVTRVDGKVDNKVDNKVDGKVTPAPVKTLILPGDPTETVPPGAPDPMGPGRDTSDLGDEFDFGDDPGLVAPYAAANRRAPLVAEPGPASGSGAVDAWAGYDEKADDWMPLSGEPSEGGREVTNDGIARAKTDVRPQPHLAASAPASTSAEPAARLVMLTGDAVGVEFALDAKECGVGRDPGNTVVLTDASASRNHAQIFRDEERYLLVDQRSANGTFVNGERIDRTRLQSGDEVAFGNVVFRFLEVGDVFKPADVAGTPILPVEVRAPAATRRPAASWRRSLLVGVTMMAVVGAGASVYVRSRGGLGNTAARRTMIFDHYSRGIEAFKARQWSEAETQFNAVLALDPSHMRGQEYLQAITKEKRAQAQLDEARTSRRAGDLLHASTLATGLLDSQFRSDAQEILREVDTELDVRVGRAQTSLEAGQGQEALQLLQGVEAIRPGRPDVAALMARAGQAAPATGPSRVTVVKRKAPAATGPVGTALRAFAGGSAEAALTALQGVRGSEAETLRDRLEKFTDAYQSGVGQYKGKRALGAIRDLSAARGVALKIGGGPIVDDIDRKLADMHYVLGIQAYLSDKLPEAYQEFRSAVKTAPDQQQAKRKLAELEHRAQEIYNEGYVLKDQDLTRARARWQLVLEIVPPDSDYYRKAKQRLDALP